MENKYKSKDSGEKKEHYGFRLADVEDHRAREAYKRWGGGRRRRDK